MKIHAFLLLSVLLLISQSCQNNKPTANTETIKNIKVDHLFNGKYKPYFLELIPSNTNENAVSTDSSHFLHTSIIRKTGLETGRFKNTRLLEDKGQISQLAMVLNDTSTTNMALECYEPRHGIAWYNKNDNIEAFLEICFECNNYKTWGNISINGQKSAAWFKRLERAVSRH